MSSSKITFTNMIKGLDLEPPQPASKTIPSWYQKTSSYINNEKVPNGNGGVNQTIKRCMPVFDAMISGYIVKSAADVYVSQKDGSPYFEWSSLGLIEFHGIEQAELHPAQNGFSYPKWINPWSIKTPRGYSVLVTQPMHRDSPFTILPGVVDTDTYTAPINFPFVLNDPNFSGYIKAGTPIAQIIPFKRESWEMRPGTERDFEEAVKSGNKLRTSFFDSYKDLFRSIKEYR